MPLGNCSSGLSTPLWSRSSSLKRFVISSFLRTTTSTIQFHRRQRRRGCRGRDSPIFDLQGLSCVDNPQYLTSVLFFPFSGTSEYRKSLPFSSVMHHITPFRDEKFINFLGRGTAPPQTRPSRRLRRLDSRVFGARPATPNVPVALTPMFNSIIIGSKKPTGLAKK